MDALFLKIIVLGMLVLVGLVILLKYLSDDDEEETTPEFNDNRRIVPTLTPNDNESIEDFAERLENEIIAKFELDDDLSPYTHEPHNNNYYIAGLPHYVSDKFVTYGAAIRDKGNKYNSRAVALFDKDANHIGFVPDRMLEQYWDETEGEPTPIIAVGFIEQGELRGRFYTYKMQKSDAHRMVQTYLYFLKRH